VATLHPGQFRQFYRSVSATVLCYFRSTDKKMLLRMFHFYILNKHLQINRKWGVINEEFCRQRILELQVRHAT
jgi:hypothetical protein